MNPPPGAHRHRRAFCPRCDRYVFAEGRRFEFALHAGLAAVTCGVWLPVALLALAWHLLVGGGDRCPNCGGRCR